MNLEAKRFLKKMLDFFPEKKEECCENVKWNRRILETVIIEDIFMPEIIELLEKNTEKELIGNIFRYFEEETICEDSYFLDIFSTTVLEKLGDDPKILEIAQKYMGINTKKMQMDADMQLGRI